MVPLLLLTVADDRWCYWRRIVHIVWITLPIMNVYIVVACDGITTVAAELVIEARVSKHNGLEQERNGFPIRVWDMRSATAIGWRFARGFAAETSLSN